MGQLHDYECIVETCEFFFHKEDILRLEAKLGRELIDHQDLYDAIEELIGLR